MGFGVNRKQNDQEENVFFFWVVMIISSILFWFSMEGKFCHVSSMLCLDTWHAWLPSPTTFLANASYSPNILCPKHERCTLHREAKENGNGKLSHLPPQNLFSLSNFGVAFFNLVERNYLYRFIHVKFDNSWAKLFSRSQYLKFFLEQFWDGKQ